MLSNIIHLLTRISYYKNSTQKTSEFVTDLQGTIFFYDIKLVAYFFRAIIIFMLPFNLGNTLPEQNPG